MCTPFPFLKSPLKKAPSSPIHFRALALLARHLGRIALACPWPMATQAACSQVLSKIQEPKATEACAQVTQAPSHAAQCSVREYIIMQAPLVINVEKQVPFGVQYSYKSPLKSVVERWVKASTCLVNGWEPCRVMACLNKNTKLLLHSAPDIQWLVDPGMRSALKALNKQCYTWGIKSRQGPALWSESQMLCFYLESLRFLTSGLLYSQAPELIEQDRLPRYATLFLLSTLLSLSASAFFREGHSLRARGFTDLFPLFKKLAAYHPVAVGLTSGAAFQIDLARLPAFVEKFPSLWPAAAVHHNWMLMGMLLDAGPLLVYSYNLLWHAHHRAQQQAQQSQALVPYRELLAKMDKLNTILQEVDENEKKVRALLEGPSGLRSLWPACWEEEASPDFSWANKAYAYKRVSRLILAYTYGVRKAQEAPTRKEAALLDLPGSNLLSKLGRGRAPRCLAVTALLLPCWLAAITLLVPYYL